MITTDGSIGGPDGPPASKTEYALQRLRDEISSGVIRPGEALRQADLAKRYGISPTPVREALRLLEAEGAISYAPHRGATVSEMTEQRVQDLYLLRAATEGLAARLAAERRSDAQLAELEQHHQRLTELSKDPAQDPEKLSAWNRELHLMVCAAGSAVITSQVMNLWRMFPTRVTTSMWDRDDLIERFLAQHDRLIAAIVEGDGAAAEREMATHIMSAAEERLRAMT
jgi:DNA-binding GntR family transcriptional regulator